MKKVEAWQDSEGFVHATAKEALVAEILFLSELEGDDSEHGMPWRHANALVGNLEKLRAAIDACASSSEEQD